jgi:hypothetical protein
VSVDTANLIKLAHVNIFLRYGKCGRRMPLGDMSFREDQINLTLQRNGHKVHYLEDTKVVSCRFRRCSRLDLRTPKMLISAGLVLVTSSAENDPPDFDFDLSL